VDAYRKHPINPVEEEEIDIEHGDSEQSKYAAQRKFLIALHYHTKEFKVFFFFYSVHFFPLTFFRNSTSKEIRLLRD
jgi:hypothetical protein